MSTAVDGDEVGLWLAWKRVSEVSRARVMADVIANSPLTEPELTVLAHLDEAGGELRQNALATAVGWDRTRLSHLLTRMEERGHLRRERLRNGAQVQISAGGRAALATTRAPLAAAVRQHFARRLDDEQLSQLTSIIEALSD